MHPRSLLAEVGRRLRAAREASRRSVAEVADSASVSPRYLRMAEAGEANLSLLKLASLTRALALELGTLCDIDLAAAPERRVALLGARGAGKSTMGRLLAQQLEVPFVELDALIEERAGMDMARLFAVHGESWYRELQAESLEGFLSQHGEAVLATGGSIVNDEAAFDRLRATCRTVWLAASPQAHWSRVVAQGDLRPMEGRPRAMVQLESLLAERAPRYALADLTVQTDGKTPVEVAREVANWVSK
ncbi:MAG: transcriptional regulator [Planctomycetota bacterium]|nr:MAG: transcriptional regulator [Planctomycetota bacterium]